MRGRTPMHVDVVDPFPASLEQARAIVEGEAASAGNKSVTYHADIDGIAPSIDFAVIATGADIRRRVFEQLVGARKVGAVLLEKFLCQTRADIDAIEALLERHGIPAWVNCGRRGWDSYHALAKRTAGQPGTVMRVSGSNYMLASNAIHFIDLFALLCGAPLASVDTSDLDRKLAANRRAGYIELTGTLRCTYADGSRLELVSFADGQMPILIEIVSPKQRFLIREWEGQLIDAVGAKGGAWETAPFQGLHVSQMPYLYDEIMTEGRSRLTPFAESAAFHRLLLDAFRSFIGLDNAKDEPCPIT